jgi:ABC-2 type transport system ATP-binding protein
MLMSANDNGIVSGRRADARAAADLAGVRGDNGIEAAGLMREFKKGPRAVDGVDLAVAPGEIYGFLGPNGAGKSTMVHMLTTLLPPTAGAATVAGHDIVRDGPAVRDAIGVALQEAALDPLLSAREHMRLQAGMHGIRRDEARRLGDALIERVGLSDAADRRVAGYSGGMKRRLDLALALVHSPRVLFLDEPTTGLDVQSRTALWDEVARLAKEDGVTVFLTTQYLEEADQLADRVGIIDRGKLVAEGTPGTLKAEIGRPTVEAAPSQAADEGRLRAALERFGTPTQAAPGAVAVRLDDGVEELAAVVRALDAESIRIGKLDLHAPSLDDVFLAKTGRRLEGAGDEVEAAERRSPAGARLEPEPAAA